MQDKERRDIMMESDREILESLTVDDLQEQHRGIAEAVGVEGLISLTDVYGGSSIYIPQKKELVRTGYTGTSCMNMTVPISRSWRSGITSVSPRSTTLSGRRS